MPSPQRKPRSGGPNRRWGTPVWLPRSRRRGWGVLLLLVAVALARLLPRGEQPPSFPYDSDRTYRVERVVDGDTLVLEPGWRVRLLGVDTPETKHPDRPVEPLGPEATEFTRRFVEGRDIRLEFDRERRDAYHRILAYVYVNDRLLNEELVRAGYSEAEVAFPLKGSMKRRLLEAEEEARRHDRGLWAERSGR